MCGAVELRPSCEVWGPIVGCGDMGKVGGGRCGGCGNGACGVEARLWGGGPVVGLGCSCGIWERWGRGWAVGWGAVGLGPGWGLGGLGGAVGYGFWMRSAGV